MKTILRLKLTMVGLALATLQSAAATLPPNATGRHLIAFAGVAATSTGRHGGLYLMRDDNSALRQLTGFPEVDGTWSNDPRKPLPDDQPSISPDGTKIVFTSNRAGSFDIWVMEINGGHLKRLTASSAREVDPVWSPDGQFIAYASDQGSSELKIWQMRADGSEQRQLTIGAQEDTDPAWYPNGGTIAFSRKVGLNDYDIFILRRGSPTSSGFVEVRLTNRNGVDRFPIFSPNGARLIYASERAFDLQTPYGHIVSSAFSDTAPLGTPINLTDDNQRLGDFRRGGAGPSFSPDGAKLVGFNSDGILITTSQQQLMRLTTTGASAPTAARILPRPFHLCINPSYGQLATLAIGKLDNSGQPELVIGVPRALAFPDPRAGSATDFIRGVVCVKYDGPVGQFALTPRATFAAPGSPLNLQLVWRHPRQWRLLNDVHLRFVNEAGVWAWVKFNEETSSLSLYDEATGEFGAAVAVGDDQILRAPTVAINAAGATLVGSGSAGFELTMTLPIEFTTATAGQRLRVEVFATDDRGGSQGWNSAGEVTVLQSPQQPWLQIGPDAGAAGQAGPIVKIHSVPGQRVQLEQSTNLVTWTVLREIENPTGEVSVDLSTTDLPRRFYRVRSE